MKEVKLEGITQLDECLFARKVDGKIEIFEAVTSVTLDSNTSSCSLRDKVISGSVVTSHRWWVCFS